MTSRNFGQFLTTLSPLSHVLLLRPCYCFHKILNPLPHKTVASFMDKPLPTFEWFCRTFAAPCVRKIPILMIALCVRGRAREYNRETKTRPTVNSVSLKQTEYLFSVFFFSFVLKVYTKHDKTWELLAYLYYLNFLHSFRLIWSLWDQGFMNTIPNNNNNKWLIFYCNLW